MREDLKGKFPVGAHQFSESSNMQHQSSVTCEDAKAQRKTNALHSNERFLTPFIRSPSMILARLLDVELIKKIFFHQTKLASKEFQYECLVCLSI